MPSARGAYPGRALYFAGHAYSPTPSAGLCRTLQDRCGWGMPPALQGMCVLSRAPSLQDARSSRTCIARPRSSLEDMRGTAMPSVECV